MYSEVKSDYLCETFTEDDGDIQALVSIEGVHSPDDEHLEVIAHVILSKRGDILVTWFDNGARMMNNVLVEVASAKRQLKEIRDRIWAKAMD